MKVHELITELCEARSGAEVYIDIGHPDYYDETRTFQIDQDGDVILASLSAEEGDLGDDEE